MQPSHSPNQCCKRTSPMRTFIIFTALLLTLCKARPETKHLLVETEDEVADDAEEVLFQATEEECAAADCGWGGPHNPQCRCRGLIVNKSL